VDFSFAAPIRHFHNSFAFFTYVSTQFGRTIKVV
jgi:hypothetical protein